MRILEDTNYLREPFYLFSSNPYHSIPLISDNNNYHQHFPKHKTCCVIKFLNLYFINIQKNNQISQSTHVFNKIPKLTNSLNNLAEILLFGKQLSANYLADFLFLLDYFTKIGFFLFFILIK